MLKHTPEPRDHLGKSNNLLDTIGHQVSQVGQHREAGGLLLTGVGAAALLVVHHQQVVEVHLVLQRLCSEQHKDGRTEKGEKETDKRSERKTVT